MQVYDVELNDQAQAETEQAYFSLSSRLGLEKVRDWYDTLLGEVSDKLSYLPKRYQMSEDGCAAYPGIEVRQYLSGNGGSAWRIYYHIIEPRSEEEQGVVRILRVRHAAMRPLGQAAEGDL